MRVFNNAFLVMLLVSSTAYADNYVLAAFGVSEPAIAGYADDTALKIGFGSEKSDRYAFEVSYVGLGKFEADASVLQEISNDVGAPVTSSAIKITGVDLSVLSMLPLSNTAFVQFDIGVYLWDAEFTADSPVLGSDSFSEDGNDLNFGVGLNLVLSGGTTLVVAYDQYEAVDGNVDLLNAGIKIGF